VITTRNDSAAATSGALPPVPAATSTIAPAKPASPAASGISRRQVGSDGLDCRAAPSGEICTRRSESTAAAPASAGTPTAISAAGPAVSRRSAGKKAYPSMGIRAA
jgi:hypothetical protein